MAKLASHIEYTLRDWKIPRDGTRRYLYDIWQPLVILVVTASFTGVFYANYTSTALRNPNDLFFCNADGKVELANSYYRPLWDPRLYFTINIVFGQFAFSTAKIIGAAWDAIVGRGGQMVVAVVAYRTIRRSLTLAMESYAVSIPAVTALYCQQVQLFPVAQLIYSLIRPQASHHVPKRHPNHFGRIRIGMQIITCSYVLLFSTMVPVMTGYSAQWTGYFGYDAEGASQLQPISKLSRPGMVLYDGARLGLPDLPLYASRTSIFPSGVGQGTMSYAKYTVVEFLKRSRDLEEPYGTLVDYYFTCSAILEWSASTKATITIPGPYNVTCAYHECSCSLDRSNVQAPKTGRYTRYMLLDYIESNITIDGKRHNLGAPPLTIGLATYRNSGDDPPALLSNVTDFWSEVTISPFNYYNTLEPLNRSSFRTDAYMSNNVTDTREATILDTGRCVAQDAYSWGFSSLLLLTFCSYTLLFALLLIMLQTDVYWNSKHDRAHQHHSIYTDVLYLAEELKSAFGGDVDAHMRAPKAFAERVAKREQGLRLDADDLPPASLFSRWRELRMSSSSRGRTAVPDVDETEHELRALKAHSPTPGAPVMGYEELASVAGDDVGIEVDDEVDDDGDEDDDDVDDDDDDSTRRSAAER